MSPYPSPYPYHGVVVRLADNDAFRGQLRAPQLAKRSAQFKVEPAGTLREISLSQIRGILFSDAPASRAP